MSLFSFTCTAMGRVCPMQRQVAAYVPGIRAGVLGGSGPEDNLRVMFDIENLGPPTWSSGSAAVLRGSVRVAELLVRPHLRAIRRDGRQHPLTPPAIGAAIIISCPKAERYTDLRYMHGYGGMLDVDLALLASGNHGQYQTCGRIRCPEPMLPGNDTSYIQNREMQCGSWYRRNKRFVNAFCGSRHDGKAHTRQSQMTIRGPANRASAMLHDYESMSVGQGRF